jgi:hypothetical protein
MRIKPECDVESAEDFAKYYMSTYMEGTDGQVLRVVDHHGSNIVLRNYEVGDKDDNAFVMIPWRKVQKSLVYGRPASSLFKVGPRVYSLHMSNNRQAGRGFKAEYYHFTRLGTNRQLSPGAIAPENELAKAVYRVDLTPLPDALILAKDKGEDSILDSAYSIFSIDQTPTLYRKWEEIGKFKNLLKKPTLHLMRGYNYVEPHVRQVLGFEGEIKHEAA